MGLQRGGTFSVGREGKIGRIEALAVRVVLGMGGLKGLLEGFEGGVLRKLKVTVVAAGG